MPTFENAIRFLVTVIEGIGAAVIVISVVLVVWWYVRGLFPNQRIPAFREARRQLGRGLVLGLEFFVGADIINTIVSRFSIESLIILGGIVILRTILSFSLDWELRETEQEYLQKQQSGEK